MKYINPFKTIAELRAKMKVMTFCLDSRREEIEQLKTELAAMTTDRDMWQDEAGGIDGIPTLATDNAKLRAMLAEKKDREIVNNNPALINQIVSQMEQLEELRAELAAVTEGWNAGQKQIEQLRAELAEAKRAAQAVIDRWHTPLWKDVPHTAEFIHALERAIKEKDNG